VALGLKGGGGNFGVVIAAELALPPVAQVYAGILFYPVGRADEVLSRYGSWSRMLPDEMTTAVAFRRFPRLPAVPEPLRGHTFVTVRGCWSGEDLAEGERLLKPLREGLGEPHIDTFTVLPTADLDAVSMDPVAPARAFHHSEMLRELTAEAVDTLVGLGTYSPLIMLELRQLGGALSQPVGELSPIGHSNARFALTAVGPTPTPESISVVRAYMAYLAQAIRPHVTGTTYVSFLDLDGATPERVRAAYSSDDWARLVQLKYRYDPHNVFRFNRNVPPGGHGPVLPR
jgi:Berberine and berberine like